MKPLIKVIALDIYGTVLATNDPENVLPVRKGFEKLLDRCDKQGIKVVTASDENLSLLECNLGDKVDLIRFNGMYELKENPKDFSRIIRDYRIESNELLVIGDGQKDRDGAIKHYACLIRVPEYVGFKDNFDLNSLNF